MSEEEYYEKYGTPYMYTVDVPWAEKLYARIDEFRSLIKSDYLEKDFEALEQCMQKAVETHDVNYLHEIYYRLHDLDYYLFRYGPEDVGKITDDDSTARKYYGGLEIYNNILPKMISGKAKVSTESYKEYWESGLECVMRSYYRMSDGHFRTEVTENKEGLITEVFSYVYSMELRGKDPFSDRNVKCVVLSNTKNISFNDVQWGEEGYALEILKEYEPEEAILVSVQLCEL